MLDEAGPLEVSGGRGRRDRLSPPSDSVLSNKVGGGERRPVSDLLPTVGPDLEGGVGVGRGRRSVTFG